MAENFPHLMNINLHIQEGQWTKKKDKYQEIHMQTHHSKNAERQRENS